MSEELCSLFDEMISIADQTLLREWKRLLKLIDEATLNVTKLTFCDLFQKNGCRHFEQIDSHHCAKSEESVSDRWLKWFSKDKYSERNVRKSAARLNKILIGRIRMFWWRWRIEKEWCESIGYFNYVKNQHWYCESANRTLGLIQIYQRTNFSI